MVERMILALEAGQAKGGDRRWGNLQSAIKVADPNDPGRGGDHITLAIEVGEHPEPVGEMKRIYYTTGRGLGYRTFSQIEGYDVVEPKRCSTRWAIGARRPALAAFPAAPAVNVLRNQELRKADRAAFDKVQAEARRLVADCGRDFGLYDAEAVVAVDRLRQNKALNYATRPVSSTSA